MKNNVFMAAIALAMCCSCSDSNYLLDTEQELAKLESEYETGKYKEEKIVGEDGPEKIETSADALKLQASMDEYVVELMNRSAVAKEKVMRTAYSSTNSVVGVFKISTCGSLKELTVGLDCEDHNEDSGISGNVGASYVDGNGNVRMIFCLANADRYYPGGVLLVDHINYSIRYTSGIYSALRQVDAFVRHHDLEDNKPANYISSNDERYTSKELLKGHTKIDNDATLAWGFPPKFSYFDFYDYYGTGSVDYGLLTPNRASTGIIYCDDEDNNNANWIKKFNLGYSEDNSITYAYARDEYGVLTTINTTYSVSLSTDPKFKKENIYYTKGFNQ